MAGAFISLPAVINDMLNWPSAYAKNISHEQS